MKKTITILFAFAICMTNAQVSEPGAEASSKSLFEVTVDGKTYTVEEGQEIRLEGKFDNPRMSVKLKDQRKFQGAGITFDYPNNFSFESSSDPGSDEWILDGNDHVIMIYDIAGVFEVQDFINNMIPQFGEENCKTKDIEISLGGREIYGMQLLVEVLNQQTSINMYRYHDTEDSSRFIIFQDSLNEDGSPTQEGKKAFEMIDASLQYQD